MKAALFDGARKQLGMVPMETADFAQTPPAPGLPAGVLGGVRMRLGLSILLSLCFVLLSGIFVPA